jgi:signal transduction histidine kinase
MRERLAEFGGQIRVETSSSGSVVEAVIPTGACAENKEALADVIGV